LPAGGLGLLDAAPLAALDGFLEALVKIHDTIIRPGRRLATAR
jgi:hypothetical protein